MRTRTPWTARAGIVHRPPSVPASATAPSPASSGAVERLEPHQQRERIVRGGHVPAGGHLVGDALSEQRHEFLDRARAHARHDRRLAIGPVDGDLELGCHGGLPALPRAGPAGATETEADRAQRRERPTDRLPAEARVHGARIAGRGARSAGLRTPRWPTLVRVGGPAAAPSRVSPVVSRDGRSWSPLRGSPGFAPGSLLRHPRRGG